MATTAPPLFAGSGWSSRGGPPQYPAPRARRALFASTPSRMPQTAWRDGITPKYPAPVEPTVVRRLSASSSLPLLLKHRLPQTPLGPTGRDVRTAFESGGVHTEGARHLGSRLRRALAESQRERLQDRKRDRAKIDRLREKMKTQQIDEHRARQISGYVHEPYLRDRAPLSPEQAADGAEPCAREGLHRRLRDHVPEFCSREARVAVGLRRESAATRGVGIGDDLLHLILSVAK